MPCAVLSDIHGNLEALEAVLADLERREVRGIASLGDFVGYGAAPNDCLDRLRPRLEAAVAGNHDLAACGRIQLRYFSPDAAVAARWTDQRLSVENRAYLEALPLTVEWRGMWLVHSSPSEPDTWGYVLSLEDAVFEMEAFPNSVCLIGHSHVPGTFTRVDGRVAYSRNARIPIEPGAKYLINAPSVGQPRDGDPRAGYLLIEEDPAAVTHVRLEYDVERAVARVLESGLPEFLGDRLRWGE